METKITHKTECFDIKFKLRVRKQKENRTVRAINTAVVVLCCLIVIFNIYRFYQDHSARSLIVNLLVAVIVTFLSFGKIDSIFNEETIIIGIKSNSLFLKTNSLEKDFDKGNCILEIFDDGRDRNITIKEGDFFFSRYVSSPFKKELYLIGKQVKNFVKKP